MESKETTNNTEPLRYWNNNNIIINCLFKSLSYTSTFYNGNDEKEGRCRYPMPSMNCTIAGRRTMDHSHRSLLRYRLRHIHINIYPLLNRHFRLKSTNKFDMYNFIRFDFML